MIEEVSSKRLDLEVASRFDLQRSEAKSFILKGLVRVNSFVCLKPSKKILDVDNISIDTSPLSVLQPKSEVLQKKIDVIFEDDSILVLNKPPFLTVHNGVGTFFEDTLVDILVANNYVLSDTYKSEGRAGIVHRLDRNTSGAMVVAKTNAAHAFISRQIADRMVTKKYLAICVGFPRILGGKIETLIDRSPKNRTKMCIPRFTSQTSRVATSFYKVLQISEKNNLSLIEFEIVTGRTHQIRVHASEFLFCPIFGDEVYSVSNQKTNAEVPKRQMLHSCFLSFLHPQSETKVEYEAQAPSDFADILTKYF